MGRVAKKPLTAKRIATETRPGYYADGPHTGLYLQVTQTPSGVTRSWIFRYTSPTTRKRRELGLGSAKVRSLPNAREVAAKYRLQVLDGIDPKDQRDNEKASAAATRAMRITFREAVEQCIAAKEAEWRNSKHAQQWRNTLATYALPLLGPMYVDQINTPLVCQVLQPIWKSKTETATRVRQRIEVVFDWCKARNYFHADNPARLKGALGELLPKAQKIKRVTHHPAVPYSEAFAFVQALRTMKGVAPLALEFTLLTACRTNEVIAMRFGEIDFDAKVWTVPAARMKAGKEHRVPLCSRALNILKSMLAISQCDYVFPGHSFAKSTHLSTGAMLGTMKRMPNFSQYTPHGLRSTFRDWASDRTAYSNETIELALAHTIRNKAEAAYRRLDQLEKRTQLMNQWQVFVETPPSAGSVVQMGNTRAIKGIQT